VVREPAVRVRAPPTRSGRHGAPSLVADGIPVAIGSDGPLDPFTDLRLAITHPDNPPEALSREAAVVAYTRGSAHAEHAEGQKGTLAPGMLADLAVLSRDVFCVPVDALSATHSVLTLVGGRIVHDAGMLTKSARRRPADRREWARRGTSGCDPAGAP